MGDKILEYAKRVSNKLFKTSPFYITINIKNEIIDALVLDSKDSNVKKVQFRSDFNNCNIGDILYVNGNNWLVIEFIPHIITPRATINKCNNILLWREFDLEISYPCIISNSVSRSQEVESNKVLNLPSDSLQITVPYNKDTDKIKHLQKFEFNRRVWETQVIDNISNVYDLNGEKYGLVNLVVKQTQFSENGNNTNVINDGQGGWWQK